MSVFCNVIKPQGLEPFQFSTKISSPSFKPLEEVAGAEPGAIYTAFSKEELRDFIETVGWLKAAEKSFEFWDNPADAVYDTL